MKHLARREQQAIIERAVRAMVCQRRAPDAALADAIRAIAPRAIIPFDAGDYELDISGRTYRHLRRAVERQAAILVQLYPGISADINRSDGREEPC